MTYPPQDPYQSQAPVPYSPGPHQRTWQPAPMPPAYGAPAYPQPVVWAAPPPASGIATAALVFGIFGILGGWCLIGIPCVLAVICGHAGLAQTKDGMKSGRGQAVAGLIMGYVFVIPALIIFFTAVIGSVAGDPSVTTTPTP